MPVVVIYITSTMLFLSVAPFPYGYYTLLRIVVTGVFIWAAYICYERDEAVLPWIFSLGAILFNPLIKIHMPKEIWSIVDVAAGIFLIVMRKKIINSGQQNRP